MNFFYSKELILYGDTRLAVQFSLCFSISSAVTGECNCKMNRKEKLFEILFEKSMEVRFTYRIGQIVPHQSLLQFIIIRWLFIIVPIHEFIENTGCFESAFGIFVQWPLVLLENNTAMRFGHFELTTVQWETTQ